MPVLALKKNIELAPWADAVYGCDGPWWDSVQGLRDFGGLKMAYDSNACARWGLQQILIPDHAKSNRLLFGETGTVGGGGNSAFQALNLAVQFGAKRIVLVGVDCQNRSGAHWYGRNVARGMNNAGESSFRRWRAAFDGVADQMDERGIELINASQLSDVRAYPRRSVADALSQWGLM